MSSTTDAHVNANKDVKQHTSEKPENHSPEQETLLPIIVQQARITPRLLKPNDILQLQRTIGNRATNRLLSGGEMHVSQMGNDLIQRQKIRLRNNEVIDTDDYSIAEFPALIQQLKERRKHANERNQHDLTLKLQNAIDGIEAEINKRTTGSTDTLRAFLDNDFYKRHCAEPTSLKDGIKQAWNKSNSRGSLLETNTVIIFQDAHERFIFERDALKEFKESGSKIGLYKVPVPLKNIAHMTLNHPDRLFLWNLGKVVVGIKPYGGTGFIYHLQEAIGGNPSKEYKYHQPTTQLVNVADNRDYIQL